MRIHGVKSRISGESAHGFGKSAPHLWSKHTPCPLSRRVDAGMCRMINNFGEIAVRVLERHIGLYSRLSRARQACDQLADSNSFPSKLLPAGPHSNSSAENEGGNAQHAASKRGKRLQHLKDKGGVGAEAAAVSAACKSYGAWWGDSCNSVADAGKWQGREGEASGAAANVGDRVPSNLRKDVRLCDAFEQQEVRDTERMADACVLLVDTGHPSWPVVYADETWKEWAGAVPTCVCVGGGDCACVSARACLCVLRV
jgi:hypothetical protein